MTTPEHPHPYGPPYQPWLYFIFELAVIMLCVVLTLQAVGALD